MLALALVAVVAPATAHIATVVLLLPYGSPTACADAWAAHVVAQAAAAAVAATTWWRATGLALRLEAAPADDAFTAWQSADALTTRSPLPCAARAAGGAVACTVLRLGLVGAAGTSEVAAAVGLASRAGGLPLVVAGVSFDDTTPTPYAPPSPFAAPVFRTGHTDEEAAGAALSLIAGAGFGVFAVLASHARDAQAAAGVVVELADAAARADASGAQPTVTDVFTFDAPPPPNATLFRVRHDVGDALTALRGGEARVVLLVADAAGAGVALAAAAAAGMTGKGWTWLGLGGWVREATWRGAGYDAGAVQSAMVGALGVEPLSLPTAALGPPAWPPRFDPTTIASAAAAAAGFLSYADLNGTDAADVAAAASFALPSPPTPVSCPRLFDGSGGPGAGRPWDGPAAYAFDAVWGVAAAAAAALSDPPVAASVGLSVVVVGGGGGTPPNATALRAAVVSALRGASRVAPAASPLSGAPVAFFPNGDRGPPPPLGAVNVRDGGGVATLLATWASAAVPVPTGPDGRPAFTHSGSGVAGDARMSDGAWSALSAPVVWPDGTTEAPTDRVAEVSHAAAIAAAVALMGIGASLLAGAVLHSRHVTMLPESGVTVAIGVVAGAAIRFLAPAAVRANAAFNTEVFTLVLLPIIIFESGYALDARPFFAQLWSINAFALVGTLVSTVVIGGIVYAAGAAGAVLPLSLVEAMSFASLLSATDPVATLAVYGALRVHPTLNALVYGESVLNDAVAIVLYRTFTAFLVAPVTQGAVGAAVATFVAIMTLSTAIGVAGGLVAALCFRFVNVSGVARRVQHARGLAATVARLRALGAAGAHALQGTGRRLAHAGGELARRAHRIGRASFIAVVGGGGSGGGAPHPNREAGESTGDVVVSGGSSLVPPVPERAAGVAAGEAAVPQSDADARADGAPHSEDAAVPQVAAATAHVQPLAAASRAGGAVACAGEATCPTGGPPPGVDVPPATEGGDAHADVERRGVADAVAPHGSGRTHFSHLAAASGFVAPVGVTRRGGRAALVDATGAAGSAGALGTAGSAAVAGAIDHDAHASHTPDAADAGGPAGVDVDVTAGISETAVLLVVSYLAFATAEAVALSGIVAALACGVAMNAYTRPTLSVDGRATSRAVTRMLATLAETAVFFQIGLNVTLNVGRGHYDGPLITVTLAAMLLGRAANVFPISAALNCGRREPISWRFQLAMLHAGLRGAIAFSLALSFPTQHRDTVVNATALLCLVTIFVLGTTTVPVLDALRVPYGAASGGDLETKATATTDAAGAVAFATEAPSRHCGDTALAWVDAGLRRAVLGRRILEAEAAIAAEAARRARTGSGEEPWVGAPPPANVGTALA